MLGEQLPNKTINVSKLFALCHSSLAGDEIYNNSFPLCFVGVLCTLVKALRVCANRAWQLFVPRPYVAQSFYAQKCVLGTLHSSFEIGLLATSVLVLSEFARRQVLPGVMMRQASVLQRWIISLQLLIFHVDWIVPSQS